MDHPTILTADKGGFQNEAELPSPFDGFFPGLHGLACDHNEIAFLRQASFYYMTGSFSGQDESILLL